MTVLCKKLTNNSTSLTNRPRIPLTRQLTAARAQQAAAAAAAAAAQSADQTMATPMRSGQSAKENQRPAAAVAPTNKYCQSISHCCSNQSLSYPSATPTSSTTSRPCSCTPIPAIQGSHKQTGAAANRTQSRTSTDSSSTIHQQQDDKLSGNLSNNSPLQQQRDNVQCRICRKKIGTSEPCHLCSNCNQFICDDCASYSSTEQHWMCSSCRRRVMNPAIPAETLKELGLNQNSSAVRRMSELRLAADRKGSCTMIGATTNASGPIKSISSLADSSASSNNSAQAGSSTSLPAPSGMSRLIMSARAAGPSSTMIGASQTPLTGASASASSQSRASTSKESTTPSGSNSSPALDSGGKRNASGRLNSPLATSGLASRQASNSPKGRVSTSSSLRSTGGDKRQAAAAAGSQQVSGTSHSRAGASGPTGSPTGAGRRTYCEQRASRLVAQKTLSQPSARVATGSGGTAQTAPASNKQSVAGSMSARGGVASGHQQAGDMRQMSTGAELIDRRPAAAMSGSQQAVSGYQQQHHHMQVAGGGSAITVAEHERRASISYNMMQQQGAEQPPMQGINYVNNNDNQAQFNQVAWPGLAEPAAGVVDPTKASGGYAPMSLGEVYKQQQQVSSYAAGLAEAGGSGHNSRRGSRQLQQLIPTSDQIYARRLSDQSNLLRRSSIIDDQLGGGLMIARNRSHSNIDTVHQCSNYLYQAYDNRPTQHAQSSQQVQQQLQQPQQLQQSQHHLETGMSQQFGSNLMAQQHPFQRHSDQQLYRNQQAVQHGFPDGSGGRLLLSAQNSATNYQHAQSAQSSTNVLYLPPIAGGSSGQLTQRRLSDGGQYMTTGGSQQYLRQQHHHHQQQQQQQQLASIITTYSRKQPPAGAGGRAGVRRRYQSSDDLDDDDSSSAGSDLEQHSHRLAGGQQHQHQRLAAGAAQMHAPYSNNSYDQLQHRHHLQQQQLQQPITIPSVSVSEFINQAVATRRGSMGQGSKQQQQQREHEDTIMFAHDNQITPMQINVAIEQVIQQQQQHEQLTGGANKLLDEKLQYLAARHGSSGRILPRIPGDNQSRSLFDLLHSMGGQGGQSGPVFGPNGELLNANSGAGGGISAGLGRAGLNGSDAGGLNQQPDQVTLGLPALSPTIRRASAPEGQNIKIVVDDMDHNGGLFGQTGGAAHPHHTAGKFYQAGGHDFCERHILVRDDSLDPNGLHVGRGFGLQVMGGKVDADGKLQACITWILSGGPADKVGLREGDKIVEWDGKCLIGMSYEQVAEVIESSANVAELLVKPAPERLNDPQQPVANYVYSGRRMSQQTERDLRRFSTAGTGTASGPGGGGATGSSQQSHSGGAAGGRAKTGRKLPPIPGSGAGLLSGSSKQLGGAAATDQLFTTMRHASTGQLDQHRDSLGSQVAGAGSDSFMVQPHQAHQQHQQLHHHQLANSANSQLGGSGLVHHHQLNVYQDQQQQQSRSASELYHNRGAGGGLANNLPPAYSHQHHHQLQQQQQPYAANANHTALNGYSKPAGVASSWNSLTGQYGVGGGAQQALETTGGAGVGGPQYLNQMQLQQKQQQQQQLQQLDQRYGVNAQDQRRQHLSATGGSQARDDSCELIGLQVNIDERSATLEISILAAHNIDRDPSLDYYVRIRILPESNRFKPCTTQPSSDMNWKETFLFQNFPIQNVHRMALEIGIWVYNEAPRLTTGLEQPICEALIPIQSARERNIDFWPLRPPATSPQSRRKSLNDLIGNQFGQDASQQGAVGPLASAGYQQTTFLSQNPRPPLSATEGARKQPIQRFDSIDRQTTRAPLMGSSGRLFGSGSGPFSDNAPILANYYKRERSSSNRNLPETNKLQTQPRRASDEVSTSSSHMLATSISPGASRRSISGMNVGEGFVNSRSPASRLGSQTSILKGAYTRRDSGQLHHQHHNQQLQSVNNSPNKDSSCSPSGGSVSRISDSSQSTAPPTGYTPSGRRSSLVGIQSMAGYRSQKNSQSDATDHDSPRSRGIREASLIAQHQHQQQLASNSVSSLEGKPQPPQQQRVSGGQQSQPIGQQQRQASFGSSSVRQSFSPTSGSRRGSTNEPPLVQPRGSFALQTLRKLKRTMSLSKGSDNSQPGSNQDSRRSSSASNESLSDQGEDLAVTRPMKSTDTVVGQLKLSFSMTKGQFEVEVIRARGLKLDHESIIGVYVKVYLKGRNKGNKRKTKIEQQQCDSPVFKQTIKYDGSLVDNKLLEVSVWVKQGTLRGKIPIGVTEIRLGDLNLAQPQTSWYNLRTMDTLTSSSIDE